MFWQDALINYIHFCVVSWLEIIIFLKYRCTRYAV